MAIDSVDGLHSESRDSRLLVVDPSIPSNGLPTEVNGAFDQVFVASSVDGAMDLLAREGIDCVLTEYILQDETGVDLLCRVRNQYTHLPVILWTDAGSEAVASTAIEAGVTDYVVKTQHDGSEYSELVSRVQNVFETGNDQNDQYREQKCYEESLRGINSATRDLLQVEADTEIAHTLVNTGVEVLETSYVSIYFYNKQAGALVPAAYSDGFADVFGTLPTFSPGETLLWEAFSERQRLSIDDTRTTDDVYAAGTPIRSTLALPLGEHGVMLIGETSVEGLDDLTVEIAEILANTAEAVLDRADRTQKLREQERELQLRTRRLERDHQLNETIRAITQSLVSADSRKTIEQAVCDALIGLDRFDCTWIGDPNLTANEVVVRSQAGTSGRFLEKLPLLLDESDAPTVTTIQDRQPTIETNIADEVQRGSWRNVALLHDFRSVISVPLVHGGILYGALTIYSRQTDSFEALSVSVLTELGSLIGFALNAVEQQNALVEDEPVALTLEIQDSEDVFADLSSQLSADMHVMNISTVSPDSYLIHFSVEDSDPEQVMEFAGTTAAIECIELVDGSNPALFVVRTYGDWIIPRISRFGATIDSAEISEQHWQLTVSIPQTYDVTTFITQVQEQYPNAAMKAKRNCSLKSSPPWEQLLDECLTDRQREILTTAYYSGFFDKQRKRTGEEIAMSLDISQPAFANQLRAAQYNVFSSMFDR